MQTRSEAMAFVEVLIKGRFETTDLNPQVMHEAFDDLAITGRLLKERTPPVTNQCAITHLKLIALGVAAEIIVVVDDQDLCVRILLSVEMRRLKAA
ncbi:MAG: hypothetical protein ABGY42_17450 [bacterium]